MSLVFCLEMIFELLKIFIISIFQVESQGDDGKRIFVLTFIKTL